MLNNYPLTESDGHPIEKKYKGMHMHVRRGTKVVFPVSWNCIILSHPSSWKVFTTLTSSSCFYVRIN